MRSQLFRGLVPFSFLPTLIFYLSSILFNFLLLSWFIFSGEFCSSEANTEKTLKNCQGATGVEPVTSRSAVECSTTELYPRRLL